MAPAGSLEYAATLPRFVAYLVDGLVMTLAGFVIYLVASWFGVDPFDLSEVTSISGLGAPVVPRVDVVGMAVIGVVSAIVSAAYFVVQWSSGARATLGMRLLKLQLGNAADGRTITREQGARRWLALTGWASILGIVGAVSTPVTLVLFVWELVLLGSVVSSPSKQGLHDRFAGTAMVQPVGGSSNGLVVGCLVIIGFLVLVSLISMVALIYLGGQVSTILEEVGNSV
jgi:uncharacterized RDD family membrane protein YckC